MPQEKPVLGVTMGDPASIGPEIAAKALADEEMYTLCRPLIVGDAGLMQHVAEFLSSDLRVNAIRDVSQAKFEFGTLDVYDLENVDLGRLKIGTISAANGKAAFEAVQKVIELALSGEIDGTVTGPIQKESINLAGYKFSGHTEIFAHYTHTQKYAMLLVDRNLRIIHVSTHVSLRKACDLVKKSRILEVIRLLDDACKQFSVVNPRIGIAGLNPHASDGGLFGQEEEKEIQPAVREAKKQGFNVEGPVPADTLFSKAKGGFYDGCVAMYHDQGHIPFKMEGFAWDNQKKKMGSVRGVNVTLGLPIIRTSVDHGTALEIAGKGIASPEAMKLAIQYAVQLAVNKKRRKK